MDSSELRGTVYKTEAEAIAACDAIDLAMGLPNADMDRWTLPLAIEGGWLVQAPRGDTKQPVIDRRTLLTDDASAAKVEAMVAMQEAKTRAIKEIAAPKVTTKKARK